MYCNCLSDKSRLKCFINCIFSNSPSALVGVLVLIAIMPIQMVFMGKFFKERSGMVKSTDSRVKLVNEILQGIRVIKSYNWESSFSETIIGSRKNEMKRLKKLANIQSINGAFMVNTCIHTARIIVLPP